MKDVFYGVILDILIPEMNILKEFKKLTKKIAEKLDYDGVFRTRKRFSQD